MGIAPTGRSPSRLNSGVLAAAVIALRFLQYSGAMILSGSSLFFLYGLPRQGACAAMSYVWPKRLLAASAALLLAATLLGLIAQTGLLAGSWSEGFKADNLAAVIVQMNFGVSAVIRAALAAGLLLCLIALRPSVLAWALCAAGGAMICASFAWMGHGAASEGPAGLVHLVGDVAHTLAASIWIGALVAFAILLLPGQREPARDKALYDSLRRFSGIGSVTVSLIVLTGLVNSWFLVGPGRLADFWTTPYGQVLLAKVLVFAGMLGLAASNRFRLTPAFGNALDAGASWALPLAGLRRSVIFETIAALLVLGLVAWLGTLPPVTAGLGRT
jgi:putative copper resistance protein D